MLGRELGAAGVIVVSGLARGIDGEAPRGALAGVGSRSPCSVDGIDRDYPASHAQLSAKIEEQGLIVSEYEPGIEPGASRPGNAEGGQRSGFRSTMRAVPAVAAAEIVPVWSRCGLSRG
jgi:DNA recombination-mediator protein A